MSIINGCIVNVILLLLQCLLEVFFKFYNKKDSLYLIMADYALQKAVSVAAKMNIKGVLFQCDSFH